MVYPTIAVANIFIKKAIDRQIPDLTPMKLQKLMFYAQSWHLRLYNEALIDEFFAKWQYGPVIPSLYHEVKRYGRAPITCAIRQFVGEDALAVPVVPASDRRTMELLDKISSVYGVLRGTQLSWLTHQPDTAWSKTSGDNAVIDNNLLRDCIS